MVTTPFVVVLVQVSVPSGFTETIVGTANAQDAARKDKALPVIVFLLRFIWRSQ